LDPRTPRTRLRRRQTESAHIETDLGATDGTDEEALEAVLPLAPATLWSDGWSRDLDEIVYDANDEGTSCWFTLTKEQRAGAESRLRDMGVSTDVLAPMSRSAPSGGLTAVPR